VALRGSAGRLRGVVGSRTVELLLAPPNIAGTLGGQRVSLEVTPTQDGLRAVGQLGLGQVSFDAGPQRIFGRVGGCSFRLSLQQASYHGEAECPGRSQRVRLEVPSALVGRDEVELAALLVLILEESSGERP
jgi:hypothetical protein